MEGGRRAGGADRGDEKESTQPKASRYLDSMGSLASTYRKLGRWKEAEELEAQVMETGKMVHGQDHPDTLTSMANLVPTYLSQGRRAEAKGLQIEAANQLQTTLCEDHPSTVTLAAVASLALNA